MEDEHYMNGATEPIHEIGCPVYIKEEPRDEDELALKISQTLPKHEIEQPIYIKEEFGEPFRLKKEEESATLVESRTSEVFGIVAESLSDMKSRVKEEDEGADCLEVKEESLRAEDCEGGSPRSSSPVPREDSSPSPPPLSPYSSSDDASAGATTFTCPTCSYETASKGHLTKHSRIHAPPLGVGSSTPTPPSLSCSSCPYETTHKSHLVRHMRIHTQEKPFGCSSCPYRASQKGALITHIRTHTGEKPYGCSLCPYRATRKDQITCHMKTHTGEKPYGCPECAYRAAEKRYVLKHMRIHTGDKPFVCALCPYRAARKSYLTIHMKNHALKAVGD